MPSKVRRRPRRPGLLGRIGVALALVGLLPLALAAFQAARVAREALLEQLLRTHTVAARTVAEAVDAFLAPRHALAASLVADPRIAADASSPAAQEALREALGAWSELGVAGVALHDASGREIVRAQQKGSGELFARRLAERRGRPVELAREGEQTWALVSAARADGGALTLLVDAGAIDRALVPDELGGEARLLVLERDGAAVAGPAAEAATLPEPARQAALSARLSGAGPFRTLDGRQVVAAWAAADEGRWIVISTQPAAIAEAALRRLLSRSAVAFALAVALVAALSAVAWRALVRPIRALLAGQRQLAGLTSAPAPGSEVEELAGAMVALEQHARDRQALDQVFLGRYQVLEILGSGGMGTVFRGWDPRLQRPVALKTIHLEPSTGTTAGAPGLLAEAVAGAQIVHPNVVAIYDAQESGEIAFVAMEYVHGIGLDRYLENRGRLDWREAVPLGLALARGLAAAHERLLIHRDVKPGNVLLGSDGSIKLSDFGLAQFLGDRSRSPGRVFGTPGFLAPEALLGQPYDGRCDLFALGVILFRVVCGRYPFPGASFREVIVATVRSPSPSPQHLGTEVDPELAELVCALLIKDPASRLGPAAAVADRLARLAARHQLTWRLDFARAEREVSAAELFRSANLPTRALDPTDLT